MSKIAIVILTDTEGHESLGRIVNALTAAKEFKEGGDDIKIVFSGTGTKWIDQLAKRSHDLHGLYSEVKSQVAGACSFCAGAFGVADSVQSAEVKLLDEYGSNMSYRDLVSGGYQVWTFYTGHA